MDLNKYHEFVKSTCVRDDNKYWYACLGLAGECGEVTEHIKKSARTDFKDINDRKKELTLELGDVLWYLTRLANELGITLDEIIDSNVEKLTEKTKKFGKAYYVATRA
jgi:NTP pyrophosphatase (non-canonical NTP hydrolase)